MTQAASGVLERRLGLDAATALVVGEVIGVGIFLTPAEMARALGSPFWVLVVWLVVGATSVCGALCYDELAPPATLKRAAVTSTCARPGGPGWRSCTGGRASS